MSKLIQKKCTVENDLARYLSISKKLTEAETSKTELQIRIARLKEYFANYEKIQNSIDETCGEQEISFQRIERQKNDEIYFSALLNFETLLTALSENQDTTQSLEKSQQHQPVQHVKLPVISLPNFSGKYEEWPAFSNLFKSLIHNAHNLSLSQKLHYLKSNTSGEAAELIKNLQISDANYNEAWQILDARYNHKRFIIDAYLKVIFNIPIIKTESAVELRQLRDKFCESVRALKSLGQPTDTWDTLLVYLMVSKFDVKTHRFWELSLSRTDVPTFVQLVEFLDKRWQCLEMVAVPSHEKYASTSRNTNITKQNKAYIHLAHNTKPICPCCKHEHYLNQCNKFINLPYQEKTQFTRDNNLCFNCLRKGHSSFQCKSSTCRTCNRKHHTLLHNNIQSTNTNLEIPKSQSSSNKVQPQLLLNPTAPTFNTNVGTYLMNRPSIHKAVLLSTALVNINTSFGDFIVRALIDSGSQVSLISTSLVQRLQLPKTRNTTIINGLGDTTAGNSNAVVNITISSITEQSFSLSMKAFTMSKITAKLPSTSFDISQYSYMKNIPLADPKFNVPGEIELLIGADVYSSILVDGLIKGPPGTPIVQNTHLGWILFGEVNEQPLQTPVLNFHLSCSIENILRRFWEVEEIASTSVQSIEDVKCENQYRDTHSRSEDGRFIVHLPFNTVSTPLGNSRDTAVRRLLQVEKSLSGKPEIKQQYIQFMQEYLQLEHMELIPDHELFVNPSECFYLPHHAVVKDSSSTTKLRVVFDGSAKTHTGVSLNNKLLVGPVLQQDITTLLIRWRKYKIAFVADVEKMYRQIIVYKPHTNFQRIVWRDSPANNIQDFRLKTVTYGTTSAPYLAIKSLRQLAIDHQHEFPLGSNVVLKDFYVDDLISGANSLEEANKIRCELIDLLQRGKFNLRKWYSNSSFFMKELPLHLREESLPKNVAVDQILKTLGIFWSPAHDCFNFTYTPIKDELQVTKRTLLSGASKLYDPLGWVAPVVIVVKILFQQLWLTGLNWDDKLPSNLQEDWLNYQHQLKSLESIKINRWLGFTGIETIQIHGFSDASSKAYAAAVYARIESTDGVIVTLLAAKTKVAPIKTVSIPRLELCGAVLLSKLVRHVVNSLEIPNPETFYWTDNTTVLAWIRKQPCQWTTYVANRVSEIQTVTTPIQWHFVQSEDNPSDCASRGIMPLELKQHPLWWSGPAWLKSDRSKWPYYQVSMETIMEIRKAPLTTLVVIPDITLITNLIGRYSNIEKLIRVTSYCARFISNCKVTTSMRILSFLTAAEQKNALTILIKAVQQTEFGEDIDRCKSKDDLLRSSKIKSLTPFMDADNLLRVGGRLKNPEMSYCQRHPIILPKRNNLTNLLIRQAHIITLHGGSQLMMAHINNSYWVLGLRDIVRTYISRCLVCFRHKAVAQQQLMGKLPTARSTPSRAFLHTGVDYAGPIHIRMSPGRGCKTFKGYICLFVCLVSKAVHLEAVSDLSSQGFIAAYRRFTSRRGKCSNLYSDCGTNFIGANNELAKQHKLASTEDEQISIMLANDGTTWNFIPPASPNFGGLWEAGVKSVKTHLKKIIGDSTMTFEEMATLLTQIEACLNSRPLCPMSNKLDDINVLTPGHFLIGDSLIAIPDHNMLNTKVNRLTRWQHIQQLLQQFWRIWSTEYLHRLQQRPKWTNTRPNIQVGQLVLLKVDNFPPTKWPLARILKTHPGGDNLVRVVTLRYNGTELTRPISKICTLPSSSQPDC